MSVINTMLKDLERRGVDEGATGDKILGGLSSGGNRNQDSEAPGRAYLLSLISVIVIVAIIAGGYYVSPYKLVAAAGGNADLSMAHAGHAISDSGKPQAQQTKSEPAVSNAVVAVQEAKAEQDKAAFADTSSAQLHESTPTLQKVSLAPSTQVATATVPKVVGTVKRDVPEAMAEEETVVQKAVARPAHSKSVSVTEGDTDSTESTEESLHVVTKQQRAFTPAEKSKQAYAAAVNMYDQGRKQEAKSSLTQSLALDPTNIDACRLLTVVYLEDGRADLAVETVKGGLKSHDNDQNLLRLYVQALVKQKKYSEAIMVMGRRIQLTSPNDLGYLAGLYQKNNDHIEAVKYYAQALQLVPSKSVWWLGQGISLEILQQYKEAIKSYEKSVSTGELSSTLMQYAINRVNVIKQHHPDLKS